MMGLFDYSWYDQGSKWTVKLLYKCDNGFTFNYKIKLRSLCILSIWNKPPHLATTSFQHASTCGTSCNKLWHCRLKFKPF